MSGGFRELYGRRLGPQNDAQGEMQRRIELDRRTLAHLLEGLGARALIAKRRRNLPERLQQLSDAPGPDRVNYALPELPFWFAALDCPPISGSIGDLFSSAESALVPQHYDVAVEAYLASSPDPENRPVCGLLPVRQRRYFLAVFPYDVDGIDPITSPSVILPRAGSGATLRYINSAALLRKLKEELQE